MKPELCKNCNREIYFYEFSDEKAWYHSSTRVRTCGYLCPDKDAEPKVTAVIRYESCVHCDEEIELFFADDGREIWMHHRSKTRYCALKAFADTTTTAEPRPKPDPEPLGLPEPDPQFTIHEDDLIGQLGLLNDIIVDVEKFFLDGKNRLMSHDDWCKIWAAHGEKP